MNETTPPKKDFANNTHEAIGEFLKVCIGPASPLINFIWPSLHQKEVEKWRENIHVKLEELGTTDQNFSLEKLQNNPEFTSVLIQATQIATRNFQKEKLEYLKNIILNTPGMPTNPDLKLTFLNFIDELSVNQIRLLSLLYKDKNRIQHLSGYPELYEFFETEHEINWSKDIFKMYMRGLETRGLIWMSKSFNDFEDGMFNAFQYVSGENESEKSKLLMILETGKGLLKYITRDGN